MNMIKKTIIFDLGGVLIDWDPRYLYRKIFSDREEMEFFLGEVCSLDWSAQMDGEKSFSDAINELIPRYPEYADQIQAYYSRWEEMIKGDIPETVSILAELRNGDYSLAALSNWSSETFPIVNARYEFLDWFDPLIISGMVGLVKPDPEIFHLILCSTGQNASDCIYVDDLAQNIQTAAEIGFDAIHYSSPQQLREELESRGILTAII